MASVEQVGFDYEFIPELPEEYVCIICHCALRSPKQIETCGHRFCDGCFEKLKNWNNTSTDIQCPFDRQVFTCDQVFNDKATERLILNWNVKCSNHNNGCEWIGELHALQAHEEGCSQSKNATDSELTRRISSLEKQVKSNATEIAHWKNKFTAANNELVGCKNELSLCQRDLVNCKDEIASLKNQMGLMNQKLESQAQKSSQASVPSNYKCNNDSGAASGYGASSSYSKKSVIRHMKCPVDYDGCEIYSHIFYLNETSAFQFGFWADEDEDDELSVTLYRCRGRYDDEFGYIYDDFPAGFELRVKFRSNDGSEPVLTFTKETWKIGSSYERSLGEEYVLQDYDCYDIDEYYRFTYEFILQ